MSGEIYLGMKPGDLDGKPYAKYWNPEMKPLPDYVQNAHQAASSKKMNGDDSNLSDREKYLHNPNYVTEYVGNESMGLEITFYELSI